MAMRLNDLENDFGGSGGGNFGFVPSFDFQLFQLPNFSELFANEFGAMTRFNANTPTAYVDYSLNQLLSALQPPQYPRELFLPFSSFQNPMGQDLPDSTIPRNRPKFCADSEGRVVPCGSPERIEGGKSGISLRGIFGLPPVTGDVMCNDCTAEQLEELRKTGTVKGDTEKLLGNIPGFKITKEMGYLFIGVIILVLLLLFARK